jgi:hypothetical protein
VRGDREKVALGRQLSVSHLSLQAGSRGLWRAKPKFHLLEMPAQLTPQDIGTLLVDVHLTLKPRPGLRREVGADGGGGPPPRRVIVFLEPTVWKGVEHQFSVCLQEAAYPLKHCLYLLCRKMFDDITHDNDIESFIQRNRVQVIADPSHP